MVNKLVSLSDVGSNPTSATMTDEILKAVLQERERCAKIAERFAFVELCADDTAAGLYRARPFQVLAAEIRKDESDRQVGGSLS